MTAAALTQALYNSMPAAVWHSSLYQRGGLDVVQGLHSDSCFMRLAAEAAHCYQRATENFSNTMESCTLDSCTSDGEQPRGGNPRRSFLAAEGGPVQDAFFHDPVTLRAMSSFVGAKVTPSGARGTYSYYCRPGDYLALHRDIETCDLALITMLSTSDPHGSGLYAYPEHIFTPLGRINSAASTRQDVPIAQGHSALILGGLVPHGVTPLPAGETRIVSILCYTIE